MRIAALAPALASVFLLSACTAESISGAVDNARQTASGALNEARLVKERAEGEYDAAVERVDNIREGMQKINEGRELLKRGLTGSGS